MTRACALGATFIVLLFGLIVFTDDHLAKSVSSLAGASFLAFYLPLHIRVWKARR